MKKLTQFFCLLILVSASSAQYYFNQFASFDGVDDYMTTPSQSEIIIDSNFTFEGWVYTQDTNGFNKTILSTVNPGNSDGYALMIQGSSANPGHAGKLLLNLNGINYSFIQTAATRVALNNWTHFAVTFQNAFPNNDTIRFYINGTLIQNFFVNVPAISNTTDPLRLGSQYLPGSSANSFRGYIDDLRIYKTFRAAGFIANDRGIPIRMNGITDISKFSSSRYAALVAAWSFDGDGNEGVGTANNFTPMNGAVFINNSFNPNQYRGQSNFYMRFGGNWLTGADFTNSVYDGDTALTLEAWVYIDAYRAQPQTIISKGTSGYSYILSISSSPSNSPALILNSGAKFLQSANPIPIKTWTHIAATYRASTGLMQIFVNGILDATFLSSPGNITPVNNDSVYIGRTLFGEYHYGLLDEIRISRYAKSQQEIQQYLYTSLDNLNMPTTLQACFGFEGNTRDNINNTLVLFPRSTVYFERLNNTAGAGGMHEAPLIRISPVDFGNPFNVFSPYGRTFSIPNGTTVRDSINVSSLPVNTYLVQAIVLIGHTNVGDLTVNLRNTTGSSVNLSAALGGTSNDMMTFFTDVAADSTISTSLVPFSMRIKPQVALSGIMFSNQNGYVRLSVTDNAAITDSGRVYMWGLRLIPMVGINNQNESPFRFELAQNFPNPFNPKTIINYELRITSYVQIKVFDALGREVVTLVNSKIESGNHEVEFDGSNFSSGVYFYKLQAGEFTDTKKMVLIK